MGCNSLGTVDEERYPQRTVYEDPQDKTVVGVRWYLGGGWIPLKPNR
jgi:hypothetical protein